MKPDLQTLLARLWAPFLVEGLVRLTGGASQETWCFDLVRPGGRERLVLRRRVGEAPEAASAAIGLGQEAALMRLAAARGVTVPVVRRICVPGDGLGEAIILSFVAGETLGRRIVASPQFALVRPGLAAQCGGALAGIHGIETDAALALPVLDAAGTLAWYEGIYRRSFACRPVLELAFRVLGDAVPASAPQRLVHGDFRTGNLMVDPAAGLVAVLDWELAHIGDPAEDFGWLCVNSWRFGATEHAVGGVGALPALLDAYERAGGEPPSLPRIRYWQALGSLKWAVMCLMMYEIFRSGVDPGLERAAIGRRVSECEADLLALMEQAL